VALAVEPEAETVLDDRYEIQAVLGHGGMGTAYQAFDRERHETVVLKTIRQEPGGATPENDSLVRAEIKMVRRVHHPHVGRVYEYGAHDGLRYIVTELVGGEGLRAVGAESGTPLQRADAACRMALQICGGLAAIHDAGCVHGDLRPSNVMVDADGVVRLVDFGIAPLLAAATSGALWGTRDYMSPEQSSGQIVDPRSDIYSLGLVFLERLTGRLPGLGWLEAEVPAPVLPVLFRALAIRPEDRFATAAAMATAIREAMGELYRADDRLVRLVGDLRDGDADLRWRAALGLVELGPAAAPTVDALIIALDDTDGLVRSAAASALVSIGRPAVPALLAAMMSPLPSIRFLAAEALTRMGMVPRRRPVRAGVS